ncbi:MAG: cytochrome c [Chloroflexi bacterium]|nr:cytochrome c [Chloroflexota bacterium]
MTFPVSRQGMEQIALLLLVGAAFFAFMSWRTRRRGLPWRRNGISAGILGSLAAVSLVLGYTVAPNIPTPPVPLTARFAQNPVPNDAANIDSGRALFQKNCVVCHGARGLGDGPAALSFNPRPVNLQLHVPQHAPGEVFYWISEGVPGTAMPAWKDQLSDTERWQLVRYLQQLAASGQP